MPLMLVNKVCRGKRWRVFKEHQPEVETLAISACQNTTNDTNSLVGFFVNPLLYRFAVVHKLIQNQCLKVEVTRVDKLAQWKCIRDWFTIQQASL